MMTKRLVREAVAVVAIAWCGTAQGVCIGDCNDDGEVTVNELVLGVNIALGMAAVTQCANLDANGDGEVTINELIVAVGAATISCPAVHNPTTTPTATHPPTATPTGPPELTATATLATPSAATATATVRLTPTATATPTDVLFNGTVAALAPHGKDDRLVYRVTVVGRTTKVTTETDTFVALPSEGTFAVGRKSTERDERLIYRDSGNLLYLLQIEDLHDRIGTTCLPSVLQLETPLRAGRTLSSTAMCEVRTIQGDRRLGQYRQDTSITPVEILPSVTVLAGTYEHVIRLTSTVTFSAGSTGTETNEILLVPGLGLIRHELRSFGTTETRELIDGTVGGQSVRRPPS